jgi:hypothetical protein
LYIDFICIVVYLLKARIVEAENQPLLANGSETTFVSRQRLCKHVPAPKDKHATIEVLLRRCLLLSPCKGVKREKTWANKSVLYGRLWRKYKKRGSWKGAAVQRRLEPGSRGLTIVRSRYQVNTSEDTAGSK